MIADTPNNMTPKQEESIRNKIAKIRKELAADKKRWGGFYRDSRGLRYLPPEQFMKLKDYKGGLRYLRWFNRTFPDDTGTPIFLFQWTLILFKTGNLKEAEKKAFETFSSNQYLFDTFFGKEFFPQGQLEKTEWETVTLPGYLTYSNKDPEFTDFGLWLEALIMSEKFCRFAKVLMEIDKKLETEPAGKTRSELIDRRYNLTDEF